MHVCTSARTLTYVFDSYFEAALAMHACMYERTYICTLTYVFDSYFEVPLATYLVKALQHVCMYVYVYVCM